MAQAPIVVDFSADSRDRRSRARRGEPTHVQDLNFALSPWKAVASNAWRFDSRPGIAEPDIAGERRVSLVPDSGPVQGISSGLRGGDRAIQINQGDTKGMLAPTTSDFDVTTGPFWLYAKLKYLALPNDFYSIIGKTNGAQGWIIQTRTDGGVNFSANGPGGGFGSTIPVDHSAAGFFDLVVVYDPPKGKGGMATHLAQTALTDPSSIGTLTNAQKFGPGWRPGVSTAGGFQMAFLAWGTVTGNLADGRLDAANVLRRRFWGQ